MQRDRDHGLAPGPGQEEGWDAVFAGGGGLEATLDAREAGKVRFIGLTGHGTYAPSMHLRSLERFGFDSVLLPYNFSMMDNADYARDFEALAAVCEQRAVAVQTIKSAARRRFPQPPPRRFSWYEPVTDTDALTRSVHWVLGRPGIFLNTSSDARLLPRILEAAADLPPQRPTDADMRDDHARLDIEPRFARDPCYGPVP